MSTLYTGLGEIINPSPSTAFKSKRGEVFVAQVLDVGKHSTSLTISGTKITPKEAPTLIGAIRFSRAGTNKVPENQIVEVAEPLDRGNFRLPFAGEQVIIVCAMDRYYYICTNTLYSMTNNIDPLMLQNAYESSGERNRFAVDTDFEAKRFETKNDFSEIILTQQTSSPTRLREGETVMEGRLGGLIKLTHTNTKEGVWKPNQIANIGESADGDPMLIVKAHRRTKQLQQGLGLDVLEDDDISVDNSSMYLTSTQLVPLELNSSVSMSSWAPVVKPGKFNTTEDPAARLQSFFTDASYDPNTEVTVTVAGLQQGLQQALQPTQSATPPTQSAAQ